MTRLKRYSIRLAVAIAAVYGTYLAVQFLRYHFTCTTEERLNIDNLSGISFEVVDTACDVLAKDEVVEVYARKAYPKGIRIFSRLWDHRTLLFRYDPGTVNPDTPLPSITHLSQSTILISIPHVASVLEQKREWMNMSVKYEIGYVEYPIISK